MINKNYCMSSFLMFRTIIDEGNCFCNQLLPQRGIIRPDSEREKIHNSNELCSSIKRQVENTVKTKKTALCLSGGIDSAILAKFMPEGSIAYTFKCVVPGVQVVDETPAASKYAIKCGLKHKVIEIFWSDFEKYASKLMWHKGAPIHSIEIQIYKAAMQAKADGIEVLLFGESADVLYGGMSQLLSRDWTLGEFVDRYSYVRPYYALKTPMLILKPFIKYLNNGIVDVHGFNSHIFFQEGLNSYQNACAVANIGLYAPFSNTVLNVPLDYERVRAGENKYLVREVFSKLYPDFDIPPKTPMPRPMNEWLNDWAGPQRPEFWPRCVNNMTGDQKWLIYILEAFLNMLENEVELVER